MHLTNPQLYNNIRYIAPGKGQVTTRSIKLSYALVNGVNYLSHTMPSALQSC